MGGNIEFFSNTRRYNRDEYLELEAEVLGKLRRMFNTDNIEAIKAYSTKESFGDMDLVVCSDGLPSNYIDMIVSEFNLRVGDWNKNGNVLSIAYKNFQIDLIITPSSEYRTSLLYFAYNDLGNLIGRITKKFGIKFGHKGSHLIFRDGDQTIGEVLLTTNFMELFSLIDLNVDRYLKGFDTPEDIFEFVSSSKYFNKNIYLLDNRNHYSKTRDKKRKTYSDFLKWCEGREFINEYPYEDLTEKDGYNLREPFFSKLIVPAFPHVKEEYDKIVQEHEENLAFKRYFNGEFIMNITGLSGKPLGGFMQWAREQIEKRRVRKMFIMHGEHTCTLLIKSLFDCYTKGYEWPEYPIEDIEKELGRKLDKYEPNL